MFYLSCLREILKISWGDKIRNDETLTRAESRNLNDIVVKRRIQLTGHILRLPEIRPTNVAMNWIPHGGKRHRGRPNKTWRTTVKEDLQRGRTKWYRAPKIAQDRLK